MAGSTPWVPVINLANSIIGVGVLAMPWCFNKCGVMLACCLLLFSAFLTYTSCMLLLRAAKATKRTSYENLAYHVLGGTGKMAVELCIIGLLFCSCVSFFIIIGDLGPAIISKWLSLENTPRLRAMLQMFLAVVVVAPLGLKRSVESLAAVSGLSMIFYICFTADMFLNSLYDLSLGKWTHESTMWNTKGGFVCITITTIAFSCQTVLFTIYESMTDRTIKKMQDVVKNSVSLVTTMYFVVGLCGYVTYYKQGIKGDILLNFSPSPVSDLFQMGFTLSVALSFPLVIFPCRSSLYSMFYSQSLSHSIENPGGSGGSVYIPPGKFNMITLSIIVCTLSLGIIVQNVETVLALTGATLGSFICFILPAIIYIKTQGVPNKGTAKFILFVGISLTVIGLYHNLQTTPIDETPILEPDFENPQPGHFKNPVKFEAVDAAVQLPPVDEKKEDDARIEPPNPHPPVDVPAVPKEKNIEKQKNPKEQPVVDDEHKEEEKLEQIIGKDGADKLKKDSDEKEKQEGVAEEAIEQLKEKQVEQEKKIEAQAEQIEVLKKQHDEEELERKEKERQDMLEKEERERKELKEKLEKEQEELQKEIKGKEDAALIEKAKEVIEQAGVLKGGLAGVPQVGAGLPQDNAAFGGQLPPQQQPLGGQPPAQQQQQFGVGLPQDTAAFGGQLAPQPQLGGQQLPPQPQLGGQLPPQQQLEGQLAQQQQIGGQQLPPQQLGGQQLPPQLGGQLPPQQQLEGQLAQQQQLGGQQLPPQPIGGQQLQQQPIGGQLQQQPIGGQLQQQPIGGQLQQQPIGGQLQQQPGVGLMQGGQLQQQQQPIGGQLPAQQQQLGGLEQQPLAFQPVGLDLPGGVQPGQMAQGIAQDALGFQQGVQGLAPLDQNAGMGGGLEIQPVGLGGPLEQGVLPVGLGGPLDQALQDQQKFQLGGVPLNQEVRQGGQDIQPVDQGLHAQPNARGAQLGLEQEKLDIAQPNGQGNLFGQQQDQQIDNQLKPVQRQGRAALKLDSLISDENDDVKNVADQKVQAGSKSRGGAAEQPRKSTLDDVKHEEKASDDLQLELAPLDDAADDRKREGGGVAVVKDKDAVMQLEKAVADDAADKNAVDAAENEEPGGQKKVEM